MMKILGRPMGHTYPGGKPQLINSNRSFMGNTPSRLYTADLDDDARLSLEYNQGHHFSNNVNNATHYIDKVSTAYNSEIMQAVLSHDS